MKTDYIRKASEKKVYISPVIECIKLDNEISLILNSFNSLPGDPSTPGCGTDNEQNLNSGSPWE